MHPGSVAPETVEALAWYAGSALLMLDCGRFHLLAMTQIEVITIVCAAVLAIAAVTAFILRALRQRSPAPETCPGERLAAHRALRADYRSFVGVPPAVPSHWVELLHVSS